jgi:hypothetical protein
MKNIISTILTLFVSLALVSQNKVQQSTSVDLAFRAFAPVLGTTINDNPVVEFNHSLTYKNFKLVLFKSTDLVDAESPGNYLFFVSKYQISKKKFNIWMSLNAVIPEVNFNPSGSQILFHQTNISYQKEQFTYGLQTIVSRVQEPGADLVYVARPSLTYQNQDGSTIRTELWLSNDHWTAGIKWKRNLINCDKGNLDGYFFYNLRRGWVEKDQNKKGILSFGLSYSFK